MPKQQSRALELANRTVSYVENTEPCFRQSLTLGRVLRLLLQEDRIRLGNPQFMGLLKEVQQKAMRKKDKRALIFPLLPYHVRRRYERARNRLPKGAHKQPETYGLHLPRHRPEVDPHAERGYVYADNQGYLHNPTAEYLQEAPE